MKKILWIAVVCLFSNKAYSQTNLVQNPSFETYSICPIGLNSGAPDELAKASSWFSMKDTPDYFNSCATSTDVIVPKNAAGYQNAATGSAYGGFIAYDKLGFSREVLGQQMSLTLSQGLTYYVSLRVCLAEFSTSVSEYMPCGKIGVRFSTVPCSITSPPPINNFAHVKTAAIIGDTTNWTLISGSFVADSNYKYLMIGNFYDDFNTDTLSNPPYGHRSYFYVDDVCVSTSSLTCPLLTTIKETDSDESFLIYPNPSSGNIVMAFDKLDTDMQVSVKDIYGKNIYNSNIQISNGSGNFFLDVKTGIYFVEVIDEKSKKRAVQKISVQK